MSTSGRIHVLLLVLALAAGVIGGILWVVRGAPQPSPPPPRASDAAPGRDLSPGPGDAGDPEKRSPAIETEPAPKFDRPAPQVGKLGIVRGEVLVRDGATFPQRWTLFLEPHPWLAGHETATSRRRDFEAGESAFAETDLPLGGYLVRATAPGLNCLPASVLLVEGSSDQFVTLLLTPGGFVDGGVLDFEGLPADGLDVTLESTETHQRASLSTDAAGTFLFRDVLDGEYTISFGRPDSPLLPPESIVFKSPSLRFPTRTLPPTGAVKIAVIDASLRPKPRVQISGSAPGGSTIDTFSDHLGIARARYLLPGHYRIDARTEEGLEAGSAVDLEAGKETSLEMLVRSRKRGT